MYEYDEIRLLHLEVTTKCNAACPQCPRNLNGGATNPAIPLTELTLNAAKRILRPQFLSQLAHITICGNYGDAMSAQDILEICKYIRSINPWISIELHTNGSLRAPSLWAELAQTIKRCIFAIDGLEDTNALYRRKTSWNLIIQNVSAFIGAGGTAEWNFIAFRHNEHQITEASELARRLGFKRFCVKRTSRFFKRGKVQDVLPILNNAGENDGVLEVPLSPSLRNPAAEEMRNAIEHGATYDEIIASTPIQCAASRLGSVYIDAQGLVFPCCWMAQIYPSGNISKRKRQVIRLIERYGPGLSAIDANLRSIEAIVGSEVFRIEIPNGWRKGPERLEICARQCGRFRPSDAQKTRSLI
jgi:MoaA/NifB/PqqE/SkfB family radical SAM enzyme